MAANCDVIKNIVPSPTPRALRGGLATITTHQLGPEAPRPFSVLSENHIRRSLLLPYIPEDERFMFGVEYEKKMCELINKYLELNTYDQLCYVGEPKGSLAPMLQQHFCLLKPITTVIPGHIHYEESPHHRMLPFKVSNVGLEEFFKCESDLPSQFDKVLLLDTVQYMDNHKQTFENIFKTITEFGKLLIVYRAAPMCTLPLFHDIEQRMMEYDHSYLTIIQELQGCGLDVQWEVESLPVRMPTTKWMAMLKHKFPSQLELASSFEIEGGIRELSEGVMKYTNDIVEFPDRLMFITAQRPIFTPQIARIARYKSKLSPVKGCGERLRYEMAVTQDVAQYVNEKERREKLAAEKKKLNYR